MTPALVTRTCASEISKVPPRVCVSAGGVGLLDAVPANLTQRTVKLLQTACSTIRSMRSVPAVGEEMVWSIAAELVYHLPSTKPPPVPTVTFPLPAVTASPFR